MHSNSRITGHTRPLPTFLETDEDERMARLENRLSSPSLSHARRIHRRLAFFETQFIFDMCKKFYLFESICIIIIIALCSAVHVIRFHAIYDKTHPILAGIGLLILIQVCFCFLTLFSLFYCIILPLFPRP
jgi:hypothetical protein